MTFHIQFNPKLFRTKCVVLQSAERFNFSIFLNAGHRFVQRLLLRLRRYSE